MIFAKFLWGNVFIGGKLQIDATNSNFEIFESALYMKSVSMPLNVLKHSALKIQVKWKQTNKTDNKPRTGSSRKYQVGSYWTYWLSFYVVDSI